MKLFALLVLSFCFALSVHGQKKWPEVNLRVNGIGSGTSYSTVIKRIGKPERTTDNGIDECGDGGTLKSLHYSGLKIDVLSDAKGRNFTVIAIEVTSPEWKIGKSIRIGTTRKSVLAMFGKPLKDVDPDPNRIDYVTKENLGGVTFRFEGDKLVSVRMQETLC